MSDMLVYKERLAEMAELERLRAENRELRELLSTFNPYVPSPMALCQQRSVAALQNMPADRVMYGPGLMPRLLWP
jgi:hypothetical protein